MANKIQIRRGLLADLPTLDSGELGLATDADNLYIGDPGGNILINPVKLSNDGYTLDGYLTPAVDNVHGLGSENYRWSNIVLGPGSLHMHSLASETGGTAYKWAISIDDNGELVFSQNGYSKLSIGAGNSFSVISDLKVGGDIINNSLSQSFSDILKALDGYSGVSEITFQANKNFWNNSIAYLNTASDGYGSNLASLNSSIDDQTQLNQSVLQALDGYSGGGGSGDVSQTSGFTGADGYIAFFTGDKAIAGDNDLYWHRDTNQFQVGNSLVVGADGYVNVKNDLYVDDTLIIGPADTSTFQLRYNDNSTFGISKFNNHAGSASIRDGGSTYGVAFTTGIDKSTTIKISVKQVDITSSFGSAQSAIIDSNVLQMVSGYTLNWSSSSSSATASDTGLARDSANTLKITDGSSGLGGLSALDGYFADEIRVGNGINSGFIVRQDGYVNVKNDLYVDDQLVIGGQIYPDGYATYIPTGTTQTIDWNRGNSALLNLEQASGDVTLTLNNGEKGASYILEIHQASNAGDAVNIIWPPGEVLWAGGVAPTISTSSYAIDSVSLYYNGLVYLANISQDYS